MKRVGNYFLIFFLLIFFIAVPANAQLSSTAYSQSYSCDGNTTGFAFTIPIYASYDAVITVTTGTTVTTLTAISNYTMAPSTYFPYSYSAGGTVTLSAASLCPLNSTLAITRQTPLTQLTTYKNNQVFDQTILTKDLDKIYMAMQERTPLNSTFTPVLTFGTATTGITYSIQSAVYTKIGNRVYFDISITLSSKGSATGAAVITGLPFASTVTSIVNILPQSITFTGQYGAYVTGSTIVLYNVSTAGTKSNLADTNFSNSSQMNISGSYPAAS
jgi:hypothetical protein